MYLYIVLAFCLFGPSLQDSCGQRPGSRIVNGQTASPGSWPWQISLRYNGRHICGASLITTEWAVTASHCVQQSSDPNRYTLGLGAHNRVGDGQEYRVTRVIKHPSYSSQTIRNDVAMLKLARPASLGGRVGTVCLPSHGSRVSTSATCYITGWGRISGQTNQLASQLQQSKVPVVDHATCTRKNGGVHETSMVCAGGAGSSACNGDSGGPLVCQEEGRWVLRGAASWVTAKTCPGHTYSVYARISSFVNWINQQAGGV